MKPNLLTLKYWIQKQITPEFWSMVRFYLPLVPVYLYYAAKNRSLTYFTNVNPAIPFGGLFGESKIEILNLFPSNTVPKTLFLKQGASYDIGAQWINDNNLSFPVVAKPNIGERGDGVLFINDFEALNSFYFNLKADYLLQEAITYQNEYGIFIAKNPDTGKVKVLSITGKAFLSVIGNGIDTIEILLEKTLRGWLQLKRLQTEMPERMNIILSQGKIEKVGSIGNHCLGTTFIDNNHLITKELEAQLTTLFTQAKGLYYGRLDVKANSIAEMVADNKFSILEMNGVSSEPGLAFDPSYSLWKAYRTVIKHLKAQSKVSNLLTNQGVKPSTKADTLYLLGDYHQLNNKWWFTFLKWSLLPKPIQNQGALAQCHASEKSSEFALSEH